MGNKAHMFLIRQNIQILFEFYFHVSIKLMLFSMRLCSVVAFFIGFCHRFIPIFIVKVTFNVIFQSNLWHLMR